MFNEVYNKIVRPTIFKCKRYLDTTKMTEMRLRREPNSKNYKWKKKAKPKKIQSQSKDNSISRDI